MRISDWSSDVCSSDLARPINFLRSRSEQLRWGFDLSVPLKSHIQKVVEAWRAAGAKPEERPRELQDLRGLFGNRGPGGQRPQGQDGGERPRGEGDRGGPGGGLGEGPRRDRKSTRTNSSHY